MVNKIIVSDSSHNLPEGSVKVADLRPTHQSGIPTLNEERASHMEMLAQKAGGANSEEIGFDMTDIDMNSDRQAAAVAGLFRALNFVKTSEEYSVEVEVDEKFEQLQQEVEKQQQIENLSDRAKNLNVE